MRLNTVYLLSNYVDVNICSGKVARAARILIFRDISVSCGLEGRDLAPRKTGPYNFTTNSGKV